MIYKFVRLDEAKDHLRVIGDDENYDIDSKIVTASAIVADYLKIDEVELSPPGVVERDDIWTSVIAQEVIKGATLLVLGDLYEQREASILTRSGVDGASVGIISPTVESVLRRLRDPALA